MTGTLSSGDFDEAPLSADEPQVVLSQRESELEDLMKQVDAKQADVDDMRSAIVSKQAEIRKLRRNRDISQKSEQFRAREVQGTSNVLWGSGSCNPEHSDFLREKKNVISELETTLNTLQATTDSLQEDIPLLEREISALTSESARVENSVQRASSRHHQLEQEAELIRSQIADYERDIRACEREVRNNEAVRSGRKARIEALEAQTDGKAGLPSTISNLEIEIDQLQHAIERLEEEIGDIATKENSMKGDGKASDSRPPVWQQGITENLTEWHSSVEHERKELTNALNNLKRLETRYRKLEPIAGKWVTKVRKSADFLDPANAIHSSVDHLLRTLENDYTSKVDNTLKAQRAELEQLMTANTQCEAEIIKRREELERRMALANTEQARVKEQIRNQRGEYSSREENIVAELRRLKLKLAQKKLQ
jgi:chromosome segregation ATPase